jgi:hypothetical protein
VGAGGGSCVSLGRLAIRGGARGLLRIGRGGEQELSDLGETAAIAGGEEAVEADLSGSPREARAGGSDA